MQLHAQEPAALAHGRTLYETNCASCHGPTGGGTYIAPGVRPPPIRGAAAASIVHHVRQGAHVEPAFSAAVLPESDLHDLVTYVNGELGQPSHEPAGIGPRELDPFLVGLFVWGALILMTIGLAVLFAEGRN